MRGAGIMKFDSDNKPSISHDELAKIRKQWKENPQNQRWGQYLVNQMGWTYPQLFYCENMSWQDTWRFVRAT